MKYKTFIRIVIFSVCSLVIALTIGSCFHGGSNSSDSPDTPSITPPSSDLSTQTIRLKLEQWLSANPDRQGKNKLVDILPNEPFKATAIRFPEADAAKWSNDPRQWSQIRLDLNRDGADDEKWLLKNGHTHKRETLDTNGRVQFTEYFK